MLDLCPKLRSVLLAAVHVHALASPVEDGGIAPAERLDLLPVVGEDVFGKDGTRNNELIESDGRRRLGQLPAEPFFECEKVLELYRPRSTTQKEVTVWSLPP